MSYCFTCYLHATAYAEWKDLHQNTVVQAEILYCICFDYSEDHNFKTFLKSQKSKYI